MLQGKFLALRYVGVVDESRLAGRKMTEMPKTRKHSGDESQKTSVLAGNEQLVDASDTGAEFHILAAAAVAEDLVAAKTDALTSRCHGLAPVVGLTLSVAVEKQDGPIRCQEVLAAMQTHVAVEVGVGVEMTAEAAAQDRGMWDQWCSSSLRILQDSHEVAPAWSFGPIAP